MVCIGQPMLIAGDLNADPAVIPCLAKGISAGRHVDLALAYSLGAGLTPDVTCRFSREDGTGSRRDFFVGCPNALAASSLALSPIGGLLLTFLFLLAFVLVLRWLTLLALLYASLFGLLVGWTLLIGPPRRPLVLSRMSGDVYRDELGVVPDEVVLALRGAASRSSVDDFWTIWSRNAEAGLFRAYSKAGGPTVAGSSASLGRGLLRIRNRRLGGRAAGGKASTWLYRVSRGDDVDVHCTQYFVNSTLSPVLPFRRRLKSVPDVLEGIRSKWFTQSRLLFWVTVRLYVVMVRVVLFPHFIPEMFGFLRISTASTSGCLIPLRC